jgi:hypothetical protein
MLKGFSQRPKRERIGLLLIMVLPGLSLLAILAGFAMFLTGPISFNDSFQEKLNKGQACFSIAASDSYFNPADSKASTSMTRVLGYWYCSLNIITKVLDIWYITLLSLVTGLIILLTGPKKHNPIPPQNSSTSSA